MLTDFSLKWDKFVINLIDKGGYKQVLSGLENTLTVALIALMIGMFIGIIIAVINVMPKYPVLPYSMQSRYDRFLDRFPKKPILRVVTFYYFFYAIMWILQRVPTLLQKVFSVYVAFFRGMPLMVQLLLGHFVLFPAMGFKLTALQTSIIVFGFNSGAYVAEIMRGGINSVDAGQLEAARAVGFSYSASMVKIVVPQAVKNILPTLGNEFIALLKDTSIIGYAGALDLVYAFKQIGTSTYEYMVPYLALSVIYIVLVVIITIGLKIMERWLAKSDRRR